jgi:hypothetical protein
MEQINSCVALQFFQLADDAEQQYPAISFPFILAKTRLRVILQAVSEGRHLRQQHWTGQRSGRSYSRWETGQARGGNHPDARRSRII